MSAINKIPPVRDAIVMPRLPVGALPRDEWLRIDHRSPASWRNAAVLAAYMFSREIDSGGPFIHTGRDLDLLASGGGSRTVFALAAVPTHRCIDYLGGAAPIWVLCRQYPGRAAEIGRVWVHPHARGHGHMKALWPSLLAELGTTTPHLDEPLSPGMLGLLRSVGEPQHHQLEGDTSCAPR